MLIWKWQHNFQIFKSTHFQISRLKLAHKICRICVFYELKISAKEYLFTKFYTFTPKEPTVGLAKHIMKKISVLLFIVGVIVTIGLIIYFRSVSNPVDGELMTISRSGSMVSEWPLFIGIILTFVGIVFYYVSHYEKKKSK